MKKAFVLGLLALTLAACADNRSSVNDEATTWEKIRYEVDKDNNKQ